MATKTSKPTSLSDISYRRVRAYQQAALMRLQLFMVGQTHEMLNELATLCAAILQKTAGDDGVLNAGEAVQAQMKIFDAWRGMYMERWIPLMQTLRMQAASIPFGTLAVYHEKLLKPAVLKVEEAKYDISTGVFKPQLQSVIEAANQRVYGDGLTLSSRIWKLDRESQDGINRVLMQGITEGKSAWQIAQELEQYLGAGRNCPRWTSTRLYKLTKKDIASGDRRGLKTGDECKGQGVAYNALRMARTEIQAVHHIANDLVTSKMPWIEKEQIMLSPAHPVKDICDDVVAAGEGGQGIYPKGTVRLPLHPHCLCYKTSVLMPAEDFTNQLSAWVKGEQGWPAMDKYADFLQIDAARIGQASLMQNNVALSLIIWLVGGESELLKAVGL